MTPAEAIKVLQRIADENLKQANRDDLDISICAEISDALYLAITVLGEAAKPKMWLNAYHDKENDVWSAGFLFDTKEEALFYTDEQSPSEGYVATVSVESPITVLQEKIK